MVKEDEMKTFTTGQVAKICSVNPRTVSKWFDSGRLKGYRIPGSQDRRIPREYLYKFLKEHGLPMEAYNALVTEVKPPEPIALPGDAELVFACIIVHLMEYIETGEQLDLDTAVATMERPAIRARFRDLHNRVLLPLPRKPVALLQRVLETEAEAADTTKEPVDG